MKLHPAQIWPATLATFKDTMTQMKETQLFQVASSLSYTTILSIIPLLAVSFSIFQAFGGLEKLYATLEPLILSNLTQGSSEEAMNAIRKILGNLSAGTLGVGGLIGLIFTSMSMLSSVENAINQIWRADMNRPLLQRIYTYWFFITLGPLAMSVMIGVATSSNFPITRFLPSGTGLFLITIFVFFLIYKWVPNRKVHWVPALSAAFLTSCFWNLARVGYALYTKKVVSYDKIYGSLGAVPVFLLWIFILWLIVLSGAAFSAALQRRFEFR